MRILVESDLIMMTMNKRHKQCKSVMRTLFFVLAVAYTGVSYASNLPKIVGIKYFSRTRGNVEVAILPDDNKLMLSLPVLKSGGGFHMRHILI